MMSQIIKADTVYGENNYKFITVVKQIGSFQKQIENGDTIIFPNDMFYFMYQEDSMVAVFNDFLKTKEYKNRDTIDINKLEYFYIKQSYELRSSWTRRNIYDYLIYEKALKSVPQGIIYRFSDEYNRRIFNCESTSLNSKEASQIIELLNYYMAYNYVPNMQMPHRYGQGSMASEDFFIEIIVKEENREEIKKIVRPNESFCFGLHEKIQEKLGDFLIKKLNESEDSNNLDFIINNERKLSQKKIISEIKTFTLEDK